MNNSEASKSIDDCLKELDRIFHLIEGIGHMSPIVPFLTRYAIIKSCGTVEFCFKTIVADIHSNQSNQVRNYIDNTFRNSSMNPSKSNICSTLKRFDPRWNDYFRENLNSHSHSNKIQDSLDSLNNARNTFAHGGTPTSSFENVREYFNDCIEILKIIDEAVMQ